MAVLAISVGAVRLAAAEDIDALQKALAAADARHWDSAQTQAARSGPVAQALIDWQRLRAGQGEWSDYARFLRAHSDWPGLALLHRRGEARISDTNPEDVLAWFKDHPPGTRAGAEALIAALRGKGLEAEARAEITRVWTTLALEPAEEQAFLAAHEADLSDLHEARLFGLLDQFEWQAAERMLPLVPPAPAALAQARIALQARREGVDDLILSLPEAAQNDPGLAVDRFRWRARNKLHDLARELMAERSTSAEALHQPTIWASLRADYARASLRARHWKAAEDIAKAHFLTPEDKDYPDLEFLAGYAALKQGAGDRALTHFSALEAAVTSPISLSRALYWQGRAHEVAGDAEAAQTVLKRAAGYASAYYGQLAAERIGAPMPADLALAGRGVDSLPQWRRSDLRENPVFQAGSWAYLAGDAALGQRFFLHLAETAPPEDIGRMARFALELHQPWYALRLAKRAASRGAIYPAAYFPLTGLERRDLDLPPELVMAIARRESEFNPSVGSSAGAKGLMQLLPATAKQMARKHGLPFEAGRLTTDGLYNATLGAAYLEGLRAQFGPSIALVAAGYNAGPGRSRQWTERHGDIRAGTDPVDWVEAIPFDETRNYVMRVAEALPVYRARIQGAPVALRPSADLTGEGLRNIPPPQRGRTALVLDQSTRPPLPRAPLPVTPLLATPSDAPAPMATGANGVALGHTPATAGALPPVDAARPPPRPEGRSGVGPSRR